MSLALQTDSKAENVGALFLLNIFYYKCGGFSQRNDGNYLNTD